MGKKPRKINQTEDKNSFSNKVVAFITKAAGFITTVAGFITTVVVCITAIVTLVIATRQSPSTAASEKEPDPPLPPVEREINPSVQPNPPLPPVERKNNPPVQPPKREYKKISVTTTDIASAFDDDVQITLTKVSDAYQQAFGKIVVNSSRESLSFRELTTFDPQKIGNYEIDVVKIGRDYAEFRIVRRQ